LKFGQGMGRGGDLDDENQNLPERTKTFQKKQYRRLLDPAEGMGFARKKEKCGGRGGKRQSGGREGAVRTVE